MIRKRKAAWVLAAIPLIALAIARIGLSWPMDVPTYAAVRARFTPSEAYLLDRHGELIGSKRLDFGVRRFRWVSLEGISPSLVDAVVDGEDRRFWRHHGIDWWGVLGALRDRTLHRQQRGASTITMQLASLIENLERPRGQVAAWRRKWRQARLACALEAKWDKPQILEAYLNLLGFRGELQGIGAAAQLLAHKDPSGLTSTESAVLAALLPAPNAAPERLVARACAREARRSSISCEAIRRTAAELLSRAGPARDADNIAPQLTQALLKSAGEHVRTTLDRKTQQLAHDVLRRQLGNLAARNVRDGAVVVVDNATGDVLAYVGSAGARSRAGNVDGARALRQAGSTLKPFLYAMALERRYLTAASLLDDSPLNLETASGAYIPQNYDRDFKGLVSVRTALASSLNVPAVRTLVLVGVEAFRNQLHEMDYLGIVESGDYYGYSLALGSAEVSLWEQAQAYRALAQGGQWSPLRIRQDESDGGGKRVFSAETSFLIGNILSDRAARALTFGLDNHLNTPFWSAAKTGTSKDMRDNWCIGFSRHYTVAVWVGNFEGDSMHDVSGVAGAAPAWHEIMVALHRDLASRPPGPPDGVIQAFARFSPMVEPPRQDWFLAGTEAANIVAVPRHHEIARIESPANGMVLALDPDIPSAQQRVLISAKGAKANMSFKLDDRRLGSGTAQILWPPQPGAHILVLQGPRGETVDRILFTVR